MAKAKNKIAQKRKDIESIKFQVYFALLCKFKARNYEKPQTKIYKIGM